MTPAPRPRSGADVFGTQFKDANGKYPVEVQDAVGVGKDDRIPPGEVGPRRIQARAAGRCELRSI